MSFLRVGRPISLILVFLGASLILTYPLIWSLGSALPGNLGDPLLNASILGWGAQWLAGGRDLWDAPIFHPHPDTLVYSEHLLGVTVFVAPVYWLTGNAILTYNVALIGSFVLAGVGMYLLASAVTGRKDVALVIALAFACSPIRVGAQIARLQMLMTGWLPLALWAIHRYAATRRPHYLVWFGLSTALMVLSNMYMLLIGALPIGLALLFELARARERRWRLATGYALTLVAVALLLVPVAAKYRGVQDAMGFTRDEGDIVRYSATPRSYFSAFETMEWLPWVYPEKTADRALYVGGVLLIGAAIAVAWPLVRRAATAAGSDRDGGGGLVAFYAAVCAAAVALSFGPMIKGWDGTPIAVGPYDWLTRLAPSLDGLRAPGRFGIVVAVGLGVMAAIGLSRVLSRASTRWRRVALGAATALVFVEAWPVDFAVEPFGAHGRAEDQPLYEWLRTQPPSALLELPASPHVAAKPNLTLIHQFETLEHPHALVNGSSGFNSPLADLLEGSGSPFAHQHLIPDAVRMLQTLGVRWIVVHTQDYADPEQADRVVRVLQRAPGVTDRMRFGPNHVFAVEAAADMPPHPAPSAPQIPVGAHQLVASHGHENTPHAVDSNLASGWSTGEHEGGAWLQIRLEALHDVRQIRLELGPAREHWPDRLTVTATAEDGSELRLYEGSVLHRLGVGLVHEPLEAPIVLTLPPNRSRVLTLRAAADSARVWSVRELMLYGWPSPVAGPGPSIP